MNAKRTSAWMMAAVLMPAVWLAGCAETRPLLPLVNRPKKAVSPSDGAATPDTAPGAVPASPRIVDGPPVGHPQVAPARSDFPISNAAARHLFKGRELLGKEDFAGAEREFDAGVEADPTAAELWYERCMSALRAERDADALRNYRMCQALDGGMAGKLSAAWREIRRRRPVKHVDLMMPAKEYTPEEMKAEVLRRAPGAKDLLVGHPLIEGWQGPAFEMPASAEDDIAKARALFDHFLDVRHSHSDSLCTPKSLAFIALARRHGLRCYMTSAENHLDSMVGHSAVALFPRNGRPLLIDPTWAGFGLCESVAVVDDVRASAAYIEQWRISAGTDVPRSGPWELNTMAAAVDPDHSMYRCNLAALRLQMNDTPGSLRGLEELLKIDPGHLHAAIALAGNLLLTGRLAEAETRLAGLVEKVPHCHPAVGMLSDFMSRTGRFDEAARKSAAGIRAAPFDVGMRHVAAVSLLMSGRFEDATMQAKVMERLTFAGDRRPELIRVAALCGLGRFQEAEELYRRNAPFPGRPDMSRAFFARFTTFHRNPVVATSGELQIRISAVLTIDADAYEFAPLPNRPQDAEARLQEAAVDAVRWATVRQGVMESSIPEVRSAITDEVDREFATFSYSTAGPDSQLACQWQPHLWHQCLPGQRAFYKAVTGDKQFKTRSDLRAWRDEQFAKYRDRFPATVIPDGEFAGLVKMLRREESPAPAQPRG